MSAGISRVRGNEAFMEITSPLRASPKKGSAKRKKLAGNYLGN